MPEAIPPNPTIGVYKGQPWILFDTVAAASFLLGDGTPAGLAIGTNTPAISANGEMVFFNAPGRSKANYPWLTNLDVPGQLAYGFEVWAIAVEVKTPLSPTSTNTGNDPAIIAELVAQAHKLAEALTQYTVVELNLGQEEQSAWPLTAFGNGGALWSVMTTQNSEAEISCSLKLPEPIAMGRTQNLSCKLKIAPFMFPIIGFAAPGVSGYGATPPPSAFQPAGAEASITVPQPPFGVQMKLIGRRIKQTQYGASPT